MPGPHSRPTESESRKGHRLQPVLKAPQMILMHNLAFFLPVSINRAWHRQAVAASYSLGSQMYPHVRPYIESDTGRD